MMKISMVSILLNFMEGKVELSEKDWYRYFNWKCYAINLLYWNIYGILCREV